MIAGLSLSVRFQKDHQILHGNNAKSNNYILFFHYLTTDTVMMHLVSLCYLECDESIARYLKVRDCSTSLPFATNFDQGIGKKLFVAGQVWRAFKSKAKIDALHQGFSLTICII